MLIKTKNMCMKINPGCLVLSEIALGIFLIANKLINCDKYDNLDVDFKNQRLTANR